MVPFAAKFGYTEEDLKSDHKLEDLLMDQYAREQGHDPAGSWILIVHADASSDILRFDDPVEMWCCDLAPLIRSVLNKELKEMTAGAAVGMSEKPR